VNREIVMGTINRGKRILVTGGAGFIGCHICVRLLQEGAEVICLDNFFTGHKSNISGLINNISFDVMRHDVHLPIWCEVDEIYHLACPASPVQYQKHPVETVTTSVQGAINVLDLARRTGARVLLASTSEIYGNPMVHPQLESYNGNVSTIGERACYDEGKRCAETLFKAYERQYNIDIGIARIFNTYGPNLGGDDGRVVSNFIMQALNNEDITIYGDGSQTRSFCYVSDTVDGLIRLMNKKRFSDPVNIGNPSEFTVIELANLVVRLTNSSSKVRFMPLPADDPIRRKPDINLAREQLEWSPLVTLEEGLISTIQYFRSLTEK